MIKNNFKLNGYIPEYFLIFAIISLIFSIYNVYIIYICSNNVCIYEDAKLLICLTLLCLFSLNLVAGLYIYGYNFLHNTSISYFNIGLNFGVISGQLIKLAEEDTIYDTKLFILISAINASFFFMTYLSLKIKKIES